MVDTVHKPYIVNNVEHKGYIQFKGYPINPYIVPGGERIQVSARNYAPGIDMFDSLKAVGEYEKIP
jgi:hypothetical protein